MKSRLINYIFTPIFLVLVIIFIFFYPTFFPNNSIIEVDKKVELNFIDNNKDENVLIFFGYVGCIDVCTPKLKEISNVYNKIYDKKNINFYFINLTESFSSKIADMFAKNFNKDFVGIQLPKKELEKLKTQFNVFSVKSIKDENELDHTSFVFYVKKENKDYKLKRIFTSNRFDEDFVINELLGL